MGVDHFLFAGDTCLHLAASSKSKGKNQVLLMLMRLGLDPGTPHIYFF